MKLTNFLQIPVFILCLNQLHGQPFHSFDYGPRFADYGPPTDSAGGFDSFPRSYSRSPPSPPYEFDRRSRSNFRNRHLDPYDGFVGHGSRARPTDRFEPLERSRSRLGYTDHYQSADRRFSSSHMRDTSSTVDRTDYRDPYITPDLRATRGSSVEHSSIFGSRDSPRRTRDRYEPVDRLGNSRQNLNEFNSYERRQDLLPYRDFPHDYPQDFDSRRPVTIDPWTGERIYRPTWDRTADRSMRREGHGRFEPRLDTERISDRRDRSITRRPVDRITSERFTQTTAGDQRHLDNSQSTSIGNSMEVINDSFGTDLRSSRRSRKSRRQSRRRGRQLGVSKKKKNLIGQKTKSSNQQSGQESVTKAFSSGSDMRIQSSKGKGIKEVIAKSGQESSGVSGADKSVSENKNSGKRKKNSQTDLPSDKKRVRKIGKDNIVYKSKEKAKVENQTMNVKPKIETQPTTDKPILVNLPNSIHESFAGIAIIDLSPFGVDATSLSNINGAKNGQATSSSMEYSTLAQAIATNLDSILSNTTNTWDTSTNVSSNKDKSSVMSTPDFEVIFLNANDSSLSAEIKTLISNNSQEIIAILNEAPSHPTHQQGNTESPRTTPKKGLERAKGTGHRDYIKYMFPSDKYALAAMLGLGKHRVPGRASPSAAFTPTRDSNMANVLGANLGLQGRFPNNFGGNLITPDLMLQNTFMEGLF